MIRTLETKTGLNASNFTPNIALLCPFMKKLFWKDKNIFETEKPGEASPGVSL